MKSALFKEYYTVYSGNSLPTFRDNLSVPFPRVKKFNKKTNKSAYLVYIAAGVWNDAHSKNICVHLWPRRRFIVLFHNRLSNAQFTLHQTELLLKMINSTFCERSRALFVGNMTVLSRNGEIHENPQLRCPPSEQRFWSRASII